MSHRSKNSNNGLFRQTAAALHFTRQFHEFLSRMYRSSIVSSLYNIAHAALHYILQLTVHMHYTTSGVVNSKSVTEVMTELRSSPLLLPLVSVALPPPLYLLLSLPLPPLVVLPSPLPAPASSPPTSPSLSTWDHWAWSFKSSWISNANNPCAALRLHSAHCTAMCLYVWDKRYVQSLTEFWPEPEKAWYVNNINM